MKFSPLSNPILLVSDPPEGLGGLSRVCRDIAGLLATIPEFRVGILARAGEGRAKFPWTQYSFPLDGQWGEHSLPRVWNDFSQGMPGVVLSNWDISRLGWLSQPQGLPKALAEFYGPGRQFRTALYSPVDGTGPSGDALPMELRHYLAGWDKVCAASWWGREVMIRSGRADAEFLPHGLWLKTFHPVLGSRALLDWSEGTVWIGSVMANQARKDFGIWAETLAILRGKWGSRLRAWLHTDVLVRDWNVVALVADYGLEGIVDVTLQATDEQLALRLSACDAMFVPSRGEGFCLPVAEALACGTPAVTTDYAAAAELTRAEWRVSPVAFQTETIWNLRRAVLSGHGFARALEKAVDEARARPEDLSEECVALVEHLDWPRLKHLWQRWLLGLLK